MPEIFYIEVITAINLTVWKRKSESFYKEEHLFADARFMPSKNLV